jgi:hypothetical protein
MAWVILTNFLGDRLQPNQGLDQLLDFLISGELPCTGLA